jgi:hypothetical protein
VQLNNPFLPLKLSGAPIEKYFAWTLEHFQRLAYNDTTPEWSGVDPLDCRRKRLRMVHPFNFVRGTRIAVPGRSGFVRCDIVFVVVHCVICIGRG